MWDGSYNVLLVLLTTLLTAVAIKVMDDLLDQEIDLVHRRENLVNLLGGGIAAYAMLALVAAVALRPAVATPLFCAAYAIGMGYDFTLVYPTGVRGWGEALTAIILSLITAGSLVTISAILLMLAVQITDNAEDNETAAWPLNLLFGGAVGKTPALVCATAMLGIAISLTPLLGVTVLIVYVLFFAFERWCLPCI